MQYKKFDLNDINKNVIKTHPDNFIVFKSGSVYYENNSQIKSGLLGDKSLNLPDPASVTAAANRTNPTEFPFYKIDLTDQERYGQPLGTDFTLKSIVTSSIKCDITDSNNIYFKSLKNVLEWNSHISPSYSISNFVDKEICMINIPNIFYGSTIKKGTVELEYYYTGSLVSKICDIAQDGRLIETITNGSHITEFEKIAGVVLYNEGIILLSGSWDLLYENTNKWNLFSSASSEDHYASGSFNLKFKGTNYISTISMLAHAEKNEFNTSTNKTAIDQNSISEEYVVTASSWYKEDTKRKYKNTVSSNYQTVSGSFKKQTFIDKIGIYDENYKLIAIAKLATPVKKNNERDYTFKLKLDL